MKVLVVVLSLLLPDNTTLMQKVGAPLPSIDTLEKCEAKLPEVISKISESPIVKDSGVKVFGGCFNIDVDVQKQLPISYQ